MGQPLLSFLALIVTLGVLITVHEFGHFWVARRCGVRVLRFSVGFGRPLWRRLGRDGVEYVIGAIPLGGYVRMLDGREGEVPAGREAQAFDRQPVARRFAIVAAGPLFNFIFAILAYCVLFSSGVPQVRPVLSAPPVGTAAAAAGFQEGDEVVSIDGEGTGSLDLVLMRLAELAKPGGTLEIRVRDQYGQPANRSLALPEDFAANGDMLSTLGLLPYRPRLPAVIGGVIADGAGAAAGLQVGDRVVSVDGERIGDWEQWAARVRAHPGQAMQVTVEHDDVARTLTLVPAARDTPRGKEGLAGVHAAVPQDLADSLRVVVRYGPFEAAAAAVTKTWEMSAFTLRMLGRMLVGEASLDNLSGPLTIAQMAGQSAAVGWSAFLSFLALVSISLGVLNLLPVPVLDGGHLAWYCVEMVKGSPVSEAVQGVGQRIGLALLLALMGLAFYNDLARLLGP